MRLNSRTMTAQQPSMSRTLRGALAHTLTWGDEPTAAAGLVSYTDDVQLNRVDEQILTAVAEFRQLPTKLLKAIVFPGKTGEPQRRSVDKLLMHKLLVRVPERRS